MSEDLKWSISAAALPAAQDDSTDLLNTPGKFRDGAGGGGLG